MTINMPSQWDVQVIDYWDALLKSYDTCHKDPETFDTAEKVTHSIMEHLHIPIVEEDDISCKRQKLDTTAFESTEKGPVVEKDIQTNLQEEYIEEDYPGQVESTDNYVEDKAVGYIEQTEETADNYMEETEEVADGYIEQTEEVADNYVEETKEVADGYIKQTEEVADGYTEQTEQHEDSEIYTEPMNESEQDKQSEEPGHTEEYAQNYTAPQFNYPPPPPPVAGQDDGLSNVIMAWYYAGYYTALYQRNQSQR